jgi:hypothetical protein
MSHDAINSWIDGVKNGAKVPPVHGKQSSSVKVIRREVQSTGNIIMEIAEKIRPFLLKMFDDVRDENGMLLQPAHIRGIALNVAQNIIKEQKNKK